MTEDRINCLKKWLAAYVKESPEAQLLQTIPGIGVLLAQVVLAEIGYENLRKPEIRQAVRALLEEYKLNPKALALKLHEGLNATRTHFFAHEGQVISEREVIDFKTGATYLDIAYRLLGSYKESASMPPGGWPGPAIYLPEKCPTP